jgi:hypothetical protein
MLPPNDFDKLVHLDHVKTNKNNLDYDTKIQKEHKKCKLIS